MKLILRSFYIIISLILISCSGEKPLDSTDPGTEMPDNKAPSPPILISPEEDQACTFSSMIFEWEPSTDPEGTDVSYEFEVSKTQDFVELYAIVNTNNTFVSLDLEKGSTYYWRVLSLDDEGIKSNYFEIRSFFTEPSLTYNSIPQNPYSESPINSSTVDQSLTKLEWVSIDEDGDTLTFDVYFGTTNPPQMAQDNLEENSFEVGLSASTAYYWQIIAKDSRGAKAIGPIWHFTVN